MTKSFFARRLLAASAAAVLILAPSACGDGQPAPTSSPASPTPAPATQAADLALADRLYAEGAIEEATAIYRQAIRRGDDAQRRQALWALARAQYQQGDNSAAEDTVNDFLDEEISAEDERRALLLRGVLHFAQGDNDEAEDALQGYLETGGAASTYAQLRLADLAARRGDLQQAIAATNGALLESLPASVASDARFALAAYYQDSGDPASALDTYELLSAEASTRTSRGEALWLAADLAFETGDQPRALASLQTLLAAYPSHERSLQALDDARFAASIGLSSRALVLYSHRLNPEADAAYREIVRAGDPALAADAHYRLGILAERLQNYEEALVQYDASVVAASATQDAATLGQALWDKSLVFELLGRTDEAALTFASIADLAPASEHVSAALFRAGLIRFTQGLPADAGAIWARQSQLASDAESQARAYFWSAKVATALGDSAAATQNLSAAANLPGFDYYTLRARAQLRPQQSFPSAEQLPDTDPDWTAIESWLPTLYGPEDTAARTALFSAPAYERALELLRAGLQADAELEFEQLIEDASGDAWLLYRLARSLRDEGLHSLAARTAARFASPEAAPPPAALALAYPSVYPQIVSEESAANELSPYLLLALVRQESFYDPRAISPADAYGLTQVIPSTAEGIADELGEDDFENHDLLRPNVSLRFGAHYLGAQLDFLEGDLPAALSAYNGGPGNALRWRETAAGDPDVFLETIDFSETRAYVELVLVNYAVYLYAYALSDQPSLPLD